MQHKRLLSLGLLAALAILVQGCGGMFGLGGPKKRTTNVELFLLSQSCFQGEVVPCG